MKIWEKMNELVGSAGTKEQIKSWAYHNRIVVMDVHFEEEFEVLAASVDAFIETFDTHGNPDEHAAWDAFLEFDFIDGETT